MIGLLPLLPALPLLGATLIALVGGRLGRRGIAAIGCGSVGLAAAAGAVVAAGYAANPLPVRVSGGAWIPGAEGLSVAFGLWLDGLSLAMSGTVLLVAFLIHIYAAAYMAGDDGHRRFFAYMNLFVAAMLTLLLADNLLLLYLGWEGVGACSFLLIGFWFRKPENGAAARKAFIVTRIGDAAMLLGVILVFRAAGTADIQAALARVAIMWAAGDPEAAAAAALLLAGACGKSAQVPLHVWLPDAMAGPTPVSALIHAATMVTAGVYLVARLHPVYLAAPGVLLAAGAIGAATAVYGALCAIGQRDLKRVLAYSTISQIGYMFLALGVGAFAEATFHFMTHAFFKALLFLGAGVAIHAAHGEGDITRMGGLGRRLPLVATTFVIGAAALAAVPFVTSGFWSKDAILAAAWEAGPHGRALAVAGVVAALLTAVYATRMVLLVFGGEPGGHDPHSPPRAETAALVALAAGAAVAGFAWTPPGLGGIEAWHALVGPVFPAPPAGKHGSYAPMALGAAATAAGIAIGWLVARQPMAGRLHRALQAGLGFDALYRAIAVRPFLAVAGILGQEPVDRVLDLGVRLLGGVATLASLAVNGRVRTYVAAVAVGAVAVLAALMVMG